MRLVHRAAVLQALQQAKEALPNGLQLRPGQHRAGPCTAANFQASATRISTPVHLGDSRLTGCPDMAPAAGTPMQLTKQPRQVS